jgi:hypothetical protein
LDAAALLALLSSLPAERLWKLPSRLKLLSEELVSDLGPRISTGRIR